MEAHLGMVQFVKIIARLPILPDFKNAPMSSDPDMLKKHVKLSKNISNNINFMVHSEIVKIPDYASLLCVYILDLNVQGRSR